MDKKLSHINESGKANMVEVGEKPIQKRTAKAEGFIKLEPATLDLIKDSEIKKGDEGFYDPSS